MCLLMVTRSRQQKEAASRDDRGGWQLFLCGRQPLLFIHLSGNKMFSEGTDVMCV